jgi:cytidyltransferase-like protein
MRVAIASGFFDPIGIQHIELFKCAKESFDYLIVGVNSDECGVLKKKQSCFMDFYTRKRIVESIKGVDEAIPFKDTDGTACLLLQDVYDRFKSQIDDGKVELFFVNGGDRAKGSTPEQEYVDKYLTGKVTMEYGVGGNDKLASSSDFLRQWVNRTCERYNIDFKLQSKY